MGIQVTNQNADQVLDKFANFVSDADRSLGKGAVAYLFPGLTTDHVKAIDKPIFASRSFWRNSSVFRSDDDKVVNNYVRHVFMKAVAAKLKCDVSDVPRVFEWAGKLNDLKVDDFNAYGRPLTARRISAILEDLKSIELKRLTAVDGFRAANGEDAELPAYYESAGTLSAHKLSRARQQAVPKFNDDFLSRKSIKADVLDDTESKNYLLGREMTIEDQANDVGTLQLKLVKLSNLGKMKVSNKIEQYERELKSGKYDNGNKLSPKDKDFRKFEVIRLKNILKKGTFWLGKDERGALKRINEKFKFLLEDDDDIDEKIY